MGHLMVTIGHLRVTIGHLKATVVYIRKGNYRLFFSVSKHKAITTELHPKVMQTCAFLKMFCTFPKFCKYRPFRNTVISSVKVSTLNDLLP